MKPITIKRRGAGQARRNRKQAFPWYEQAEVWAVAKYAALTVAGIVLFRAGAAYALKERGYIAVGGEVFALFIPAFYFLNSWTVREFIEDKKRMEGDKR